MNLKPSIICRLCIATILGLTLASCAKDDEPAPQTILTVDVKTEYFPPATDNWVFVTNEAGAVIDIQNIQNGSSYTLKGSPNLEKFNVTFFKLYGDAPWTWFVFESFEGIANGTVMTLDYPTHNFRDVTGIAEIVIHNYTTVSTNPTDEIWFSTGYSAGQAIQNSSTTFEDNTLTVAGIIQDGPTDFFISAYKGDEPVYSFVKDVELTDRISLDFNSFTSFDHTINLGAMDGYGQILAGYSEHKDFDGFLLSGTYLTLNNQEEKKVGFNDGFDFYKTYLSRYGPHAITYRKEGAAPNPSFTWLPFTSEVLDKTTSGFDFSVSTSYSWKQAAWSYQLEKGGVYWYVNGNPSAICRIHQFPKILTEMYPALDFDKLTFYGASVTKNVDGYTYEQWVQDKFAPIPRERETMESWTLSLQ